MLTWLIKRMLWMVPMLLGVTFVVFLVMDLAPTDRASLEMALSNQPGAMDVDQRAVQLAKLRVRYGLVDPKTLEPLPVHKRYLRWLGNVVRMRLAGSDEDQATFRSRITAALPVSLLLGFWSVLLAFAVGVPLGCWLGVRRGSRADRVASWSLFVIAGVPEVLVATLLLLTLGGAGLALLPTVGLRSEDAQSFSLLRQLTDLAAHMALPVFVLMLAPMILIVRFVRESVSRVAKAPFVRNLDAWGIEHSARSRRMLRVGFAPLATLIGSIVPLVVTGSVVVESVFSLDGAGRLVWEAVLTQDQAMVMAITLLFSVVTLFAMALSDGLHQVFDPRVRVSA